MFEVGGGHTALLYSSPGCHAQPVTSGQPQKDAATVLLHRIQGTTLQDSSVSNRLPASWSSALLRALCFIHKVRGESDRRQGYTLFNARILSITTTSDDASQYLAVMNAIFAAQRENILIDACVLGQQNSSFMQQACYLTNGIYLKPSRPEALVQYLLVRRIFVLPLKMDVSIFINRAGLHIYLCRRHTHLMHLQENICGFPLPPQSTFVLPASVISGLLHWDTCVLFVFLSSAVKCQDVLRAGLTSQ